ncbi:hypothetical protein BSKO_03277 [Bryopsis sp. KO-2023]|nr:hypothetical protein BSKO_03277 [Bryopsis sp. KO-2023]
MVNYTKHNALVGRIAKCFNDPDICDVTVLGPNGEVFHCLRFNLCLSSEILKQMLSDKGKREIHVEDVDTASLGQMLTFLHTGQCEVTDENVIPLIATAARFQVPDLLEICNAYKDKHLKIGERNCCFLLEDALDFGAESIAEECMEFMSRNMESVCQRTEFLLLEYDIIQDIVSHSEKNLFKSSETGIGHLCMWMMLGLVRWMERDLPRREALKTELLWNLDFTMLSPEQIACICRCDIVRRSPELSMSIIDALASHSEKHTYTPSYPKKRVKTFTSQGGWDYWRVESSGWYSVIAKEANGEKPACVKVYKGLNRTNKGDAKASVGGGYYFEMGDEVRAMIGVGPSPSCVIVKSRKTGKDQMVLVAGGDLSMAFASDLDNDGSQSTVVDEKPVQPMDLAPMCAPSDKTLQRVRHHSGHVPECDSARSQQNSTVFDYRETDHTPWEYGSEWGTIGYPADNQSSLTLSPRSTVDKSTIRAPASSLAPSNSVDRVLPHAQEVSFIQRKVSSSVPIPKASKKSFMRMESSRMRKKWKKFVDVVKDF